MRPRDQVIELRNYVMQPGQRDVLIDLFEREFIEPQEALGAHVLGTFRNLDNPDRFVWLRGFADFDARYAALDGFYTGDVWKAHRSASQRHHDRFRRRAAAAPRSPATSPAIRRRARRSARQRRTRSSSPRPTSSAPHGDEAFAAFFSHDVAPILKDTGADLLATFATEHSPNNYPRLPVRENETVFVSLTRFASSAAHARACRRARAITGLARARTGAHPRARRAHANASPSTHRTLVAALKEPIP